MYKARLSVKYVLTNGSKLSLFYFFTCRTEREQVLSRELDEARYFCIFCGLNDNFANSLKCQGTFLAKAFRFIILSLCFFPFVLRNFLEQQKQEESLMLEKAK